MASGDDPFQWLAEEMATVRTRRYFVTDGPATPEVQSAIECSCLAVPGSYKAFVLRFGNAKLYREGSGYLLGVRALPEPAVLRQGQALCCFGHYEDCRAYFKESLLRREAETPVFEWGGAGLCKTAEGFLAWLKSRSSAIRRRLGKRRWAEIVRGPRPFTERELAIVKARRRFQWRVVGIADNDETIFEVRNDSDIVLPFLSIGIRARDGGLLGGVWLPVGDLPPGARKLIQKDCYSSLVSPQAIEAFDQPDPEPEDRDRYWEFRKDKT